MHFIICFWVLFYFDNINCRPTQNEMNVVTPWSLLTQHDIKDDSTNSNSGEISDKISSIADMGLILIQVVKLQTIWFQRLKVLEKYYQI